VILGVGVDLVDVDRMETILRQRWSKRFVARVFTEEEIAACEGSPHAAQCFAARFAAKEALVKALGTGFSRGVRPAQIHVRGGERSRPRIELSGRALDVAASMNAGAIHVSLTHTRSAACAVVLVEERE
jgi:holo-[acyl-carrier protein] synthase